jgi:hypothetical protein
LQRARGRAERYDEVLTTRDEDGRAVKPLALCLVLFTTACLVPKRDDFSTPESAVLTFQSKFARDDVAAELDCFSERFREQSGASLQVYVTVRDRFLDPLGWFGRFVLCRDSLEDNLEGGEVNELHARLVYSLAGHAFEITATREAAFRFPDPASGATLNAPLTGETASLASDRGGAGGGATLFVKINVSSEAAALLLEHGLPSAELVNGWKLEQVAPVEGKPSVKPLPPSVAGTTREVRVEALRVTEVRRLLGAVQLRVELPLGEASGCVRALPDGTLRIGSPPAAGAPATNLERLRWTTGAAALR